MQYYIQTCVNDSSTTWCLKYNWYDYIPRIGNDLWQICGNGLYLQVALYYFTVSMPKGSIPGLFHNLNIYDKCCQAKGTMYIALLLKETRSEVESLRDKLGAEYKFLIQRSRLSFTPKV